jgi:uncharacterized membrane protein
MSKRTVGIIMIVVGVVLLIVSLSADMLGIGNGLGIGWKQILGAVVGALIAVGGAWWGWRKEEPKKVEPKEAETKK